MAVHIQKRRDTAANWTSVDPVLADGEAGYETDTGQEKTGDGTTAWTSLPYFGGGSVSSVNGETGVVVLIATDVGADPAGSAAAALSAATTYTDTEVAQEVIDRNAAISAALSGLSWKNARAATTANITLSAPQTVDGVAVIAADRVLVKNQSTASQNGLYAVAAGAWTRTTDGDTNAELQNAAVLIAEGTTQIGTAWVQTQSAINIGSTSIVFQQLGSSVPNADASTRGIAKLYTATGSNTDGSMDQNSITTAINASAETTTTIGTLINGATAKATPVDADFVGLMDSAAANILKKLSWANIKATLKTYFDTLYQSLVNSATVVTDASTMDLTAIKHTLSSSSATRTFTISYTGDDITLIVTLSNTAAVYTFPATSLCVSDGVSSGDNTLTLAGVSGDKYVIGIKKIGSDYYVVSKNFGQ